MTALSLPPRAGGILARAVPRLGGVTVKARLVIAACGALAGWSCASSPRGSSDAGGSHGPSDAGAGDAGICAVLGGSCASEPCCGGLTCEAGTCAGPSPDGGCGGAACAFGESCQNGVCACDVATCTNGHSCNGADRCVQGQ